MAVETIVRGETEYRVLTGEDADRVVVRGEFEKALEILKSEPETCRADVLYDPNGNSGGECGRRTPWGEDFCEIHREVVQ